MVILELLPGRDITSVTAGFTSLSADKVSASLAGLVDVLFHNLVCTALV